MAAVTGEFGPDVKLGEVAYIHPSAQVYGAVTLADGVSVWPNVVMRAEFHHIAIGANTNIQDFVMVHVGNFTPTVIGANCSITHHVTIHGCTIGDNCLVGIGATIMDGCVIGNNCTIAGGAFLKEGTVIPDNSIVMGIPGKVTREKDNQVQNRFNAFMYRINGEAYAVGNHRAWSQAEFQAKAKAEMARIQATYGSA